MKELEELHLLNLSMPNIEAAYEEVAMTEAKHEVAMVRAVGTDFEKSQDLKVMNYKEAMADPILGQNK